MSIHTPAETTPTSTSDRTSDAKDTAGAAGDGDSGPSERYDAHDGAATFDPGNLCRLPNTVDAENEYVG